MAHLDAGIEPAEPMAAVQRGADLVVQSDPGVVPAQARLQRQPVGDGQHVGQEHASKARLRHQPDRRDRTVGLHDQRAKAVDAAVVGQGAEFGGTCKPRAAAIDTRAQHEAVGAAHDLAFVDELHERPAGPRPHRPAVEQAVILAAEHVSHRLPGRIGQHDLVGILRQRFEAEQARFVLVVAGLDIGGIAVDRAHAQRLVVERAFEVRRGGQRQPRVQAGPAIARLRPVGMGIDRLAPGGDKLDRRDPVAGQVGVRTHQFQVNAEPFAFVADVEVAVYQFRRAVIAPAVLGPVLQRAEPAQTAARPARRGAQFALVEAAVAGGGDGAGVGKARRRRHHHRAAQRIEAVDGAGVGQRHARQRGIGDHVEGHGVAEGQVEAPAVEIGGQSLRLPLQRRGGEAAPRQVGLPRIALRLAQRNARNAARQAGQRIGRASKVDIRAVERGRLFHVDTAAGRGNDDDGRPGILCRRHLAEGEARPRAGGGQRGAGNSGQCPLVSGPPCPRHAPDSTFRPRPSLVD